MTKEKSVVKIPVIPVNDKIDRAIDDYFSSIKEELKPCPLCGGKAKDIGNGISCRKCGLWLGAGTLVNKLGGFVKVWQMRTK